MNEQILQPKSVVFTEQRVFTLGDERFKQSLPIIESGYSKVGKSCSVTPVEDWVPEGEGANKVKREMVPFPDSCPASVWKR